MANPQKIKAEIKDIISYGRQVYKLVFLSEKKMPRFKAGQFLHLTLDDFDPTSGFWPESRVFSIASCSEDRKEISIVYSVKGIYTQKMEDQLIVGSEVWLKAPYGEFIISNHVSESETVILIAGGTGISPFIPFLKQQNITSKVQLNYGLRNKKLLIFEEELSEIANHNNISLNLFLEEMDQDIPFSGNIRINKGYLSIEKILLDIDNISNSVFFISGPPVMIDTFKTQLLDSGIEMKKIIIDEWG